MSTAAVFHGSISYPQAIILGLIQGVTELFPVSSLGHTVVLPQLFGWTRLVKAESQPESFWLPFVVGLHVGTALGLLVFYWRTWVDILKGLGQSVAHRKIETSTQRLGWLLIIATIPAGAFGLVLEHPLRVLFTKPLAASIFLMVNGLILFFGEGVRRGAANREAKGRKPKRELDNLNFVEAGVIGVAQIGALFAGISRSGITMVAGLVRGLNHEDSARFAFLLATPIILGAGVVKLPDLLGPLGNGVRGQTVVGAAFAFVAALVSVRFLSKYFTTNTLWPFAGYCLAAGIGLTIYFG
ncbi:MAG TPA: undecaprenyl-diphosphate phosphatase [Acidimicrobiales bacterium]|nr:undecaprenyl-diphosphate phosphatase [Acidimicrobiales bacterium]